MKKAIFLLLIIGTLGVITVKAQKKPIKPSDDPTEQIKKFNQFYRYLNGAYVDTVKNGALIESAIVEMLSKLDPHSSYVDAEEMIGVKESFDGSFSGIGIEFNVLNDTIIVVNVIPGGPAEKVSMMPNDRIIEVDGKSVIGLKQTEVPGILRGPKGSSVNIKTYRHSDGSTPDFSIVRDNIPINTIDAAYKINPTTGYIKVNRFATKTYPEFVEAYQKLGKVDNLILDLRCNGGGLLDQAIDLSNFFLPKGSVIVSTEGMKVPPKKIMAQNDGPFTKGKVIVLVNEGSASGSEIVAGAVQDWDRGLIVGRRTFGKGLVQRQFPLLDGSAIRLTVARYHTPTGRAIQRPFIAGDSEQYYKDFNKRISGVDSLKVDSMNMYKTLRSGRTVYGGGGVYPDIYVDMDTTAYTKYWASLIRRGVVNEFVVDYMDKHRTALEKSYPTIEKFNSNFVISKNILDQMIQLGTKKGVEFNESEFEKSKPYIELQIKALFAQKLWGMNEYFVVINSKYDEILDKAIEILQNWEKYGNGISQ